MASIFEKTMAACQESKRSAAKGNAKLVKENAARLAKAKKLQEDIEDLEDEVIDEPVEELVDEPAVEEEIVEELPEEEDVAEGTTDEVMVVVDPEIDSEEYDEFIDELEDAIDATPEGEIATLDAYAGDFAYACPICGNTFFNETELGEGDACPVCGDTPEEFVLVGEVEDPAAVAGEEATEEVPAEEIAEEEVPVEEEAIEDEEIVEEEEDLEAIDAVEEEEVADEEIVEEEDEEEFVESKATEFKLDEATFNPFLTKFVRSNYKNAQSLVVKEAYLSKAGSLRLECQLTFKSGKMKAVTLVAEKFNAENEAQVLPAVEKTNAFKVESAKGAVVAPFVFEAVVKENVISCKKLKYNFITRVAENKRAQISGKLIKESK